MSTDFNFSQLPLQINLTFTAEDLDTGDIIYDFNFGDFVFTFPILRSLSNYHTAIWCDPDASLNNGRFYVTDKHSLTIVNNKNGQAILENFIQLTNTLEEIKDINVVF